MRINAQEVSEVDDNQMTAKEIRLAKTFGLIVGSFIVCWTPITIIAPLVAITEKRHDIDDNGVWRTIHIFTLFAAHFNSVIDPIIYAYRVKDVKMTIKKISICGREEKL